MTLTLTHADSPYIRAIGFLYLRYAGDPPHVYKWIEPYLYDDEPIDARASSAKQQNQSETIGSYVRRLFTDKNYHGTILPRLPIQIERDIQVKLLQAEKTEERAKRNALDSRKMSCFQKLGAKVMALYGDDENPVQWYEGVVDRVITTDPETQQRLRHPKFVVTFPEYGNTETVTLGEMEMLGASLDKVVAARPQRGGYAERDDPRAGYQDHGRGNGAGAGYDDSKRGYSDRGHGGRGYSDSNPKDRGYGERGPGHREDKWQRDQRAPPAAAAPLANEADLYEEVRRRERETVTSSGRNAFSRRPPSTKASLSVASSNGSSRVAYSPHAPPPRSARDERSLPPRNTESNGTAAEPPKRKTAEELAEIQAKKRKLMAKYG
jgi:hypothetical protein